MAMATDIRIPAMAGQTVAVLGLGKSGLPAARALKASGAAVWAWDDNAKARDDAKAADIPLIDLAGCDWSKPSALVLSPGIPHRFPKPHPVAALAIARRCPIIGDIELMARAGLGARFIGITGTNDEAVITGTSTGSVQEDTALSSSGTLTPLKFKASLTPFEFVLPYLRPGVA
jgi:UDP-N-acetylmuramoylalanine--D-glutamate ligase